MKNSKRKHEGQEINKKSKIKYVPRLLWNQRKYFLKCYKDEKENEMKQRTRKKNILSKN
jgi:hypothetical protein